LALRRAGWVRARRASFRRRPGRLARGRCTARRCRSPALALDLAGLGRAGPGGSPLCAPKAVPVHRPGDVTVYSQRQQSARSGHLSPPRDHRVLPPGLRIRGGQGNPRPTPRCRPPITGLLRGRCEGPQGRGIKRAAPVRSPAKQRSSRHGHGHIPGRARPTTLVPPLALTPRPGG